MSRRISLALTLHNHQPVGNFGWVIAETYERAYLPMLEALERHPGVHLALHYTGPLLAWLARRAARVPRPAGRARRRAARSRSSAAAGTSRSSPRCPSATGSASSSGWPTSSRAASARGPAARGSPSGSGSRTCRRRSSRPATSWTVLDDAHFRAAAIPEEALWGPYTTDDQGKVLTVFGTEQGLRYRIPFSEVDDVIGYLRDHATEAGERVGTMGDDGEKFGGWPTTFEHCWGPTGWVERLLHRARGERDWLTTITPSGWLDGHGPVGRVYLPTGSYAEMGEWALPADEGAAFAREVHEATAEHRPEARWLRGAIWRNFQVKYREVNDLHKQMLRVSDLVDAMPAGAARDAAVDHLYAGQSNDCYWHGLFGGIYLPDLRVAALRRLILAEDLALGGPGAPVESGLLVDLDLDGADEALLVGDGQIVGDQDRRGRRDRPLGPSRRRAPAGRGDAAPAGGLPREAPRSTMSGRPRRPPRTTPSEVDATGPPRSTTS